MILPLSDVLSDLNMQPNPHGEGCGSKNDGSTLAVDCNGADRTQLQFKKCCNGVIDIAIRDDAP